MDLLEESNADDDLKLAQYELIAANVWLQENEKVFPDRIKNILLKLVKKELRSISRLLE